MGLAPNSQTFIEVVIEPESLDKAAELGSSVLLRLLVDVIEVNLYPGAGRVEKIRISISV